MSLLENRSCMKVVLMVGLQRDPLTANSGTNQRRFGRTDRSGPERTGLIIRLNGIKEMCDDTLVRKYQPVQMCCIKTAAALTAARYLHIITPVH